MMGQSVVPHWLQWAREIQALSQNIRTFAANEYDMENSDRLARVEAEIVAIHADLPVKQTMENFKVQPGYATPKIDVRAAVVRNGKILLVQEVADRRWAMPGGWADVGSRPAEMVVRETQEESGFEVEPQRVVAVIDANRGEPLEFYHAYKVIWLCEIIGGKARPSHETLAVEFFDFDVLPPLSIHRTSPAMLAEVQEHLKDPQRLTAFD
jgi:ADP-ribose pyrophosphatase YjhB (NUDIX family)